MLVFAVDAALQRCSVAIVDNGKPRAVLIEDRERGHAERIAPMADEALSEAKVKPTDIDRIGVTVGPGGFTGVRVGLSFARSLGLAAGVDVVGVTTLEALAAAVAAHGSDIASVVDARRGQVYAALYRSGETAIAPFVAAPDEAASRLAAAAGQSLLLIGSGAALLPSRDGWTCADADPQIDPRMVAALAAAAPAPAGPPAPLYLRPPDAKPPAPQR